MSGANYIVLDYDDEDFARRGAKLVRAGQVMLVPIRGTPCSLLRGRIKDGDFVDLPKLALIPKLQPLVGVVTFATARGLSVLCEEHEDMIGVWIGIARA
jgi:hypothetical protein